jgi:hypothetical protein
MVGRYTLVLRKTEEKYFSRQGLTRFRKISPSGKSTCHKALSGNVFSAVMGFAPLNPSYKSGT